MLFHIFMWTPVELNNLSLKVYPLPSPAVPGQFSRVGFTPDFCAELNGKRSISLCQQKDSDRQLCGNTVSYWHRHFWMDLSHSQAETESSREL